MKTRITAACLGLLFAIPALSMEGEFSPEDLLEATRVSIQSFKVANPGHSEHFSGFKAWKSGSDAKVKIYVNHGSSTMDFNYTCFKHGAEIHCEAS